MACGVGLQRSCEEAFAVDEEVVTVWYRPGQEAGIHLSTEESVGGASIACWPLRCSLSVDGMNGLPVGRAHAAEVTVR